MSGLTGVKIIEVMHAVRPALPAMLCTGYNEGIEHKDVEKLDIKYIQKLVDTSQLFSTIQDLIESPAN